ncbi:MAG TPA: hypothetical protein VIL98_10720 [Gaiellaceae bacterium]
MARAAFAGVAAMFVVVGSCAAATLPAFSLRDGQTRYLLPAQARAGEVIRCISHGTWTDATMPGLPAAGVAGGNDAWRAGGPAISIGRRPNGATEIRCGSATSGSGFFGRVTRYVIGQNGLGLIRGRNSLAVLERLYGRPSFASSAQCRATWRGIGLTATFGGGRCTDGSVLVGAVVEGSRWRSLRGVQVGDSVAKLLWEAQDAKAVAPGRWLLASGGASQHAKLVAVARSGTIVSLRLTGS